MLLKTKVIEFLLGFFGWLLLDSVFFVLIIAIFPAQFDSGDAIFFIWVAVSWLFTLASTITLQVKHKVWMSLE